MSTRALTKENARLTRERDEAVALLRSDQNLSRESNASGINYLSRISVYNAHRDAFLSSLDADRGGKGEL